MGDGKLFKVSKSVEVDMSSDRSPTFEKCNRRKFLSGVAASSVLDAVSPSAFAAILTWSVPVAALLEMLGRVE